MGPRLKSEMVSQLKSWSLEPREKEGCNDPHGLMRSNDV